PSYSKEDAVLPANRRFWITNAAGKGSREIQGAANLCKMPTLREFSKNGTGNGPKYDALMTFATPAGA
ncbi:MAG: hypothetical protein QOF03_85, partial [Alphaproteobacteria bacterium]|nr:hypothetical protein [Alphaproteobacteria bacterium]